MRRLMIAFSVLLLFFVVIGELNKQVLRENTKKINMLENSNSLLIAENKDIESKVNQLTQEVKEKILSNGSLSMITPKEIFYAKVEKEEVNLVFVFTDKI